MFSAEEFFYPPHSYSVISNLFLYENGVDIYSNAFLCCKVQIKKRKKKKPIDIKSNCS